jgi:hypothetical protein
VWIVPRRQDPDAGRVVHRTARIGLRLTRAQRRRCFGLLASAGDVWACVLEVNGWRRRRGGPPLAGYQELCRELAAAGPGTFGDLDTTGARSVLRRYSDAWFAAAQRRRAGDPTARYPRRRRRLLPVRYYHGTFALAGRRVRLRLRQWQLGRQIAILTDKAQLAGITVHLVDERGTSSTCPACRRRITKPAGRTLTCPHCALTGHRDLLAATTIATRTPGGAPTTRGVCPPQVITHRRAGRHLPGAGRSRRDPRRPPPGTAHGSVGQRWPAPPVGSRSPAPAARIHNTTSKPGER